MTSPFKGKTGIRRIINAASYSLDGLKAAYVGEAAFRQLTWMAMVLVPLALWLDVTRFEKALLVAVVLFSLVIELFNSAVEAAIDRISLERHELSKQAKDMGSAAQMVGLAIIALTWGLILIPAM
ncbi:diacylglycerol kinase (ATP) [Chitinivorax tropicus]|uniref:Diacylglycerol kinase n=1 Tax=Chitinivorax tropicus TaxID=714531 RepID=A0A840MQE3_9PROT|nr:diacylglycerol kinase [Chitinivorax tropicus]MBB5018393.1 diacylglycerol kinase (ATP) [Chitinivorax tropicus]